MIRATFALSSALVVLLAGSLWLAHALDPPRAAEGAVPAAAKRTAEVRTVALESLAPEPVAEPEPAAPVPATKPPTAAPVPAAEPEPESAPEAAEAAEEIPIPSTLGELMEAAGFEAPQEGPAFEEEPEVLELAGSDEVWDAGADGEPSVETSLEEGDAWAAPPPDQDAVAALIRRMLAVYPRTEVGE